MIAFDAERKAWDINSGNVAVLRLLREIYVGGTRAKRRLVILVKTKQMREFFLSLEGCNIEETDATVAFLEFESDTSRDEWKKKGNEFFEVRHSRNLQFEYDFLLCELTGVLYSECRTKTTRWPQAASRLPVSQESGEGQ